MRGDQAAADRYLKMAREYALGWIKQADDGDHFRLAFDRPNTWSSKYNLVWDKILDLNLFPDEAIRKEMAFYRKNIDAYGLPLDGRQQRAPGNRKATWSKTDWAFWTACLTNDQADFDAITAPVYRFYNEATRHVGLTDLYFTDRPDTALMHSRPVMGGIFIKMLYNPTVWKKWASRDQTKANGSWAPIPKPPVTIDVVKPASTTWRYTTQKPAEGWFGSQFNDSTWKQGLGGFGQEGTPGAIVKTQWTSSDIWLRSEITIPEGNYHGLQLNLHHDEDAEVYLNGQLAAKVTGYTSDYESVAVGRGIVLKPGTYQVAIHCHQTEGGQYIDLGIVDVQPGK
ncbi:MAG TPA: DUF1793 domain-containing protein [Tepidisphaeraceae bacterium]|nr:DUF1793 domain-containing protein [Tepidisphaeraceae bacterium]